LQLNQAKSISVSRLVIIHEFGSDDIVGQRPFHVANLFLTGFVSQPSVLTGGYQKGAINDKPSKT